MDLPRLYNPVTNLLAAPPKTAEFQRQHADQEVQGDRQFFALTFHGLATLSPQFLSCLCCLNLPGSSSEAFHGWR